MSDLDTLQAKLDASPEMQRKIANGMLAEALAEATTAPPRKDPFQWFDNMREVTSSPQLVKGVLPAGCLAVTFGESGSGKTFFTTDMALHIAPELRWRGRRVTGGLVVYVAAEAAGSVAARVAAWRRTNPLISSAPFAVLPGAVNLLDRAAVDGLITDIRLAADKLKVKPALVVFDTFARCIAGADENSAADVGEAVAACDAIRTATGATVLVVHHSGKDVARGARGSSALRAAVDVEISVEGMSGTRVATITKSRDGETGTKFAFDLETVEMGTDEDGDAISSCVVRSMDAAPVKPVARGKQQTILLAHLEGIQEAAADRMTWPLVELRRMARDIGMRKESARDAVHGLHQHGALIPTIGGSYLAAYVARGERAFRPTSPEESPSIEGVAQGRKGRNGANHPDSPRATGGERGEGSIRPRPSPRSTPRTEESP